MTLRALDVEGGYYFIRRRSNVTPRRRLSRALHSAASLEREKYKSGLPFLFFSRRINTLERPERVKNVLLEHCVRDVILSSSSSVSSGSDSSSFLS